METPSKKYSKGKILGIIAVAGIINVIVCAFFFDWTSVMANALFYVVIFLFVAIASK